jgi:hypothetical protein
MPQRKRSNTASPPGPTKPQHPVLVWLERERREHERELARKRKRLKAAFPWFRETPTIPPGVVSLGWADPNAPPLSPAAEQELIQQRLKEQERHNQMAERENAQMRLMLEQHLEARERDQVRERQTRQIRRLERRTQELEKRLEAVQALAEAAGDDTTRLAAIRAALAEFGSRGRKKRAENYEAEPWRVYARAAAIEATKANPTIRNAELSRKLLKLVAGPNGEVIVDPDDKIIIKRPNGERIEWPHPRTVHRLLEKLREDKTLPKFPPRKRK